MDASHSGSKPAGGRLLGMSAATLASYCALALALVELVLGVTYLLLPAKIGDVEAALFQAGSHPGWYQLFYAEWALTGLLGLAIVRPVTQLLAPGKDGWSEWGARLAYVSFAVSAIQGLHNLVEMPALGQLFQGCHSCTASLAVQQTLAKWLYVNMPLDPGNWLTIGALGLWFLALSAAGFASRGVPRGVLYLGISLAVISVAVPVVGIFAGPPDALLLLLIVLAAAWYVWVALLLRRTE